MWKGVDERGDVKLPLLLSETITAFTALKRANSLAWFFVLFILDPRN
jgi:hypothetical protein